MKNSFLNKLKLTWAVLVFVIAYFFVLPIYLVFMIHVKWYKYAHFANIFWASMAFYPSLIDVESIVHSKVKKDRQYIYCANHTSYLDIALMMLTARHFICFMGKTVLSKAPLPFFGNMFKRMHIPFDRSSIKDPYRAFEKAKTLLKIGYSIGIFPQGGIKGQGVWLTCFKDGAFKLAIETGIPIVPVTIPYNWFVLGKDFIYQHRNVAIVYHEPIETRDLTLDQVEQLKNKAYNIIAYQLEVYFPEIKQPNYQ